MQDACRKMNLGMPKIAVLIVFISYFICPSLATAGDNDKQGYIGKSFSSSLVHSEEYEYYFNLWRLSLRLRNGETADYFNFGKRMDEIREKLKNVNSDSERRRLNQEFQEFWIGARQPRYNYYPRFVSENLPGLVEFESTKKSTKVIIHWQPKPFENDSDQIKTVLGLNDSAAIKWFSDEISKINRKQASMMVTEDSTLISWSTLEVFQFFYNRPNLENAKDVVDTIANAFVSLTIKNLQFYVENETEILRPQKDWLDVSPIKFKMNSLNDEYRRALTQRLDSNMRKYLLGQVQAAIASGKLRGSQLAKWLKILVDQPNPIAELVELLSGLEKDL